MRVIILLLCFCLLSIHGFSEDDKNTIRITGKAQPEMNQSWMKIVSEDVALISSELNVITPETSKEKVNKILEDVFKKVQTMRSESAKYGVIVDGFSINLAVPPSMTVDFKFKD